MNNNAILSFLLAVSVPLAAEDWAGEARSSLQSKNYLEAAAICEQGMRADPNSDEIEAIYLSLPASVLAARWAERYERVWQSSDVRELIALGRALSDIDPGRKTEGPKLALGLLARAIQLAPDNPSAHFNYGRALRNAGAPGEMFAAWDKALTLHPGDALRVQIYSWIGQQRSVLMQPGPAAAAFEAAHTINQKPGLRQPRWAWEYFKFLKAQSRNEEAGKLLQTILSWSPGFIPAVLERARLSMARQEWMAAIRDAEYALRIAAGNAELERGAHSVLARAYHATHQESQARPHQSWIEQHPR
jgi:tetratricopeptide (TPR) repeat protein